MSGEDTSVDSLIRAAARAPAVAPRAPGRALRPGEVVGGNFRVDAELGRGGMGVVYRATDLTLDRQVALKVMAVERWPEEDRPRLLEIFRREARATAKLSHPAIVNLYHTGADGGLLYLVLELLHGESLQARVERSALSTKEALEIVEQILRGLAHAHERGILHRDLKPQNVFLGQDGRVRLLDFGLAALLDHVGHVGERAPERGVEVQVLSKGGTPSYMAPEQWKGEPQDERTDLWAVGMILYRLLGVASIAPPSSVEALRGGLPLDGMEPGAARLIRRATAFAPRERWESAAQMLAALEEVTRALPPPRRPARARRARRWPAALAVVGIVGGALLWWLVAPRAAVPSEALPGAYRGHFDRLVLERRPDGSYWGAYAHDQGFLQGRLQGDRLVGWWCEAPTRRAPDDAGEMELRVRRGAGGELELDGRYRYGRTGQWNENWNFTSTTSPMPDLVPRLLAAAPPCAPTPPTP